MNKRSFGISVWIKHLLYLAILLLYSQVLVAGGIHDAARTGDLAEVKNYLEAGAQVDEVDGENNTPLFIAAKYGRTEIARYLVGKGANLTHTSKGPFGSLGTPLHAAVNRNQLETVKVLLELGADANQPDTGVGPPLNTALSKSNMEMAGLLREFGAKPVSAPSISHLIASADLELGKQVSGTCSVCHSLSHEPPQRNKLGPPLWGVVGRNKAAVDGYAYSDQLRQKKGKWTYDDLNSFLSNPRAFIPGTKMDSLSGIEGEVRRAAIIAFLRTISDNPYPLP